MPNGADCGAADDRRDLPVEGIARPVSKRPFPTDGRTPPTTSPSNATHRRGTHAGSPAAKTFHSLRAVLAFDRTKPSSPPFHRQPTRSFDRPLPPDGDTGIHRFARMHYPNRGEESTYTEGSPREPGRSVQFSARPPRDHGQAPVAHFLGKFSPGNTIAADSATESLRDKRRCHDTACLRTLPQLKDGNGRELRLRICPPQVPLERHCLGTFPTPYPTVGTTPFRNLPRHTYRWNDTAWKFIRDSDDTTVGTDSVALLQPSPSVTTTRNNPSPQLSQMCAVTTTRQTVHWNIEFLGILHCS